MRQSIVLVKVTRHNRPDIYNRQNKVGDYEFMS